MEVVHECRFLTYSPPFGQRIFSLFALSVWPFFPPLCRRQLFSFEYSFRKIPRLPIFFATASGLFCKLPFSTSRILCSLLLTPKKPSPSSGDPGHCEPSGFDSFAIRSRVSSSYCFLPVPKSAMRVSLLTSGCSAWTLDILVLFARQLLGFCSSLARV